jgi:hypothetical protein
MADRFVHRSLASDLPKDTSGTQVRRFHRPRLSEGGELTASPEIFLPSYVECDFESLERKRDPVHEIRLSDEEIKQMFPQ